MTRKQFFALAALAALMVSSLAAPSEAGLVQIKLIGAGGAEQTFTLFVPENCARTEWPSYVVECQDVDPDYEQPAAGPEMLVRSPGGRLFRLAELRANDGAFSGGSVTRRHTDDIEQLGSTIGGASDIGVGYDQNGKVDVVLVSFKTAGSWDKFKRGSEGPEVPATWTGIKSHYDN